MTSTALPSGPGIAPGQTVVYAAYFGVLGLRSPLAGDPMTNPALPDQLARFQAQSKFVPTVDGIILQSGQFIGPDTRGEFEQISAKAASRPSVARAVLDQRDQGTPVDQIVTGLRAQVPPTQSVTANPGEPRDWESHYRVNAARALVTAYEKGGADALFQLASSMASGQAKKLFR